ncbi:MAG: hypothetical protein ACO1Q7_02110 [Gemmatimonas sp.]
MATTIQEIPGTKTGLPANYKPDTETQPGSIERQIVGVKNGTNALAIDSDGAVKITSTAIGATADSAVEGDSAGSVNAKLRGLQKAIGTTIDAVDLTGSAGSLMSKARGMVQHLLKFNFGAGNATNALRTTVASDSPDVAVLGGTGDGAVTTNATGSISAKLRGLVALAAPPTTGGRSDWSCSLTESQVIAANANRKGLVITNDGPATTYVLAAPGTASATNFTHKIAGDDSLVIDPGGYTGAIRAVSTVASGALRITEFT